MKSLVPATLVACAVALPAAAQGLLDPQTYLRGGYVELEGGSPFQGATTEFDNPGTGPVTKGSGHFQAGYFGGAVFGHRLAPGVSVEAEGIVLKNRYDTATEFTEGTGGYSRTYGGLLNARVSLPYDYHVIGRFAVIPYVAVGAGYGQVKYKTGGGGTTFLDDAQGGFMWQAKSGIEIKTGTPVSFDVGYRYLETPDYRQNFLNGGAASFQLKSHVQAATAGIKYTF